MKRLGFLVFLHLSLGCAASSTQTLTEHDNITAVYTVETGFGHFVRGSAISLDALGNVYVADGAAHGVLKYSANGDSLSAILAYGRERYQFDGPLDLDASLTNTIYIADHGNHRIEKYTREFSHVLSIERAQARERPLQFRFPTQVVTDNAGTIYLLDSEHRRVIKARQDQTLERVIGGYTEATSSSGVLTNPFKLAVDGDRRLLVADNGGRSLIAFDELGTVLIAREVPEVRAIAARNDTVFALGITDEIALYHAPSLRKLGRWRIQGIPGNPVLVDLDLRHDLYILSTERAYKLVRISEE